MYVCMYIYIYADLYSECRCYVFRIHLLTGVNEKHTPLIQIHAYRLLTTHAPDITIAIIIRQSKKTKYSKLEIVQVKIQIKTGTDPKLKLKWNHV